MKIIFIPFAGGTKYSYDFLKKYLNSSFYFEVLELPGHGSRMNEPLLYNLKDIVADLYINNIDLFCDDYIIFGHSMGAVLTFLLAEKIFFSRCENPKHLILSSHGCIDILNDRGVRRDKFDHDSFKELVQVFGGIPDEILNHEEAYGIFEKILRADFKALDTYKRGNHLILNIPITAICADNDICTVDELKKWEKYTDKNFEIHTFKGGHFYIFDYPDKIAEIIIKSIHSQL